MSYQNAMNRYESEPKKKEEGPSLNCSHPGCQNKWTIQIDRPMCSLHQWGTTEYSRPINQNKQK
jgi:hypothetical protein